MESGMIRMPLKWKFGKNYGRYDLSQDIYVLSVFVGDHLLVQCTLHSNSTAHECMHFLREKVELSQANFFALRYQMKAADPDRRQMRWIEMDKPLKKQLQKFACKKWAVQLAILFHTPNVFALHDPTARSLYYHLLKLDVINGRYVLEIDKYINLAAYSLQVEYGDFDRQLHTMEFLRSLTLLPPHLYRNSSLLDDFLTRIVAVYERLSGMQSSYAAFLFIVDAQQSEGYGEEFFQAKDDESTEVKIGYSPDGLIVKRCHGSNLRYRWQEIKDISQNKRCLHVKCKDSTSGVFTLEDAEWARYVTTVFNWQWQYALSDAIQHKAVPMSINNLQGSIRTFGSQPPPPRLSSNDLMNAQAADFTSSASTIANSRYSAASTSRTASSMFNINAVTPRQTPAVHAVQSFQHVTNPHAAANRVRSATSASAQQLPAAGSAPSLVQHSILDPHYANTRMIGAYRPTSIQRHEQPMTNVSPIPHEMPIDEFEMERQVLKQMLEQRNSEKLIGSSPEIHMMGTGNAQRQPNGGSHFMRRAQSNVRGYPPKNQQSFYEQKFSPHSTPDLSISSPDLISAAVASQMVVLGPKHVNAEQSAPSISASSGSSSGRIANRFALAQNTPGRLYSQGHVIASSSSSRTAGQPISFPVPLNQLDTSVPPPVYPGLKAPPTPLHRERHLQSQSSPPAHFYRRQESSALQSSIASTASSVHRLNGGAESDNERQSENELDFRSASQSSRPTSAELHADSTMLNPQKHALLNGVAKSGALAAVEQRPLSSTDKMLEMIYEKLKIPQACDAEFAAIPAKRLSAGLSTSQHPDNQKRNRKSPVFPYEDTRVMLHPTKENIDGYINASNVQYTVGGHLQQYVIAQAPMKNTVGDFWQMIWETGARLIVSLINPHQISEILPPYFPSNPKEKMDVDGFTITQTHKNEADRFQTTTSVLLVKSRCGQRRTVYHFQSTDFEESGIPTIQGFLAFVDGVNSIKRHIENERRRELDAKGGRRKSGARSNLVDVTNRNEPPVVEHVPHNGANASGGWKRKLRFTATPSTVHAAGSVHSDHSDASKSSSSSRSHFDFEAPDAAEADGQPPLVVHCTNGADEAGLFVLVDVLIQLVQNNIEIDDVPSILKTLRNQRMMLIKNSSGLRFCYELLADYLQNSRLI
ncbi:hypothetical protein M3Y99_01169900 [Aphelenchoides fujianensis]|nr:hypothetical protein M3Y99_01169900 [Aphelenchoides fujianensis]